MPLTLTEIPTNIGAFFDEETPLGPVSSESISENDVAAYLLNIDHDAARELIAGASILFGRKGAGKSSLLKAYLFPQMIKSATILTLDAARPSRVRGHGFDFHKENVVVIKVEFHEHIEAVCRGLRDAPLQTPEAAAKLWRRALWQDALWEISKRPAILAKLDANVGQTIQRISTLAARLASSESSSDYISELMNNGELGVSAEIILADLRSELARLDVRALFLIDSMEEYKVYDEIVKAAIGGLLQLVGIESGRTSYKIAFPYEIYNSVRAEGNAEKYKIRSTTISWRPIELIRIATSRMLICLYLRERDFLEQILQSDTFKPKGRQAQRLFWQTIFGGDILNEANVLEPGLYYVLRHTQLLPRQVINSLSRLLKTSKVSLRSYKHISPDVITSSLKETCDDLVEGVESGFKHTYPEIRFVFEEYLPRCEILSTYGQLQSIYANSGIKSLGFEYTVRFPAFLRALSHMGVFGIKREEETDRYMEADFGYVSETNYRFSETQTFLMHPAFSLLFKGQDDRIKLGKAVLPRGSIDGLDE